MVVAAAVTTRFAPSPTGRLHLGHAYSAIQAHDRARAGGGRFLLRIEDIDGTRSRPGHVAAIVADLRWLGLEWDGPVLFQSSRLEAYAAALERLRGLGLLYPCFCTRAEIAASLSAPHGVGPVYPGICRGLAEDARAGRIAAGEAHAWRLDVGRAVALLSPLPFRGGAGGGAVPYSPAVVFAESPHPNPASGRSGSQPDLNHAGRGSPDAPEGEGLRKFIWHDEIAGTVTADPRAHGDVVLARKDTPASYHLAVTVDDAWQGVTHVVRGVDLFAATHVHRLLQALLGLPTPTYHHHALLTGPDGARLAKRHGAPTLEAMRLAGEDGRDLADQLRAGLLPIGFARATP